MKFREILSNAPQSSQEDWSKAAEKMLKGASLESINFQLKDGQEIPPYAISQSRHNQSFGNCNWIAIANVSGNPKVALSELEGGSQGVYLQTSDFNQPDFSKINFGFISCIVKGDLKASLGKIIDVIPSAQRQETDLVFEVDSNTSVQDCLSICNQIPKAKFLFISTDAKDLALDFLNQIHKWFKGIEDKTHLELLAGRVVFELPVVQNYFNAIIEIVTLRKLYANLCVVHGLIEPAPHLRVLASISPEQEQTQEKYLIDATAKGVAAVSANIDYLMINPFEEDLKGIQRRRVRNIQHLFSIESHLAKANEPTSGAAFFQDAVSKYGHSIWNKLTSSW